MNSFDVFDTLLARRYFNSDPIFRQLAHEFNVTDFVQHRKAADTGSRSLNGIYDQLVAQGLIDAELAILIKSREIELEVEHSIPVKVNLDRVSEGDLLISDMYLPGSAISKATEIKAPVTSGVRCKIANQLYT
jgi:predicted HAD superfamily hydrolase